MRKFVTFSLAGVLLIMICFGIWFFMLQSNEIPRSAFEQIIDPGGMLDFKSLEGTKHNWKTYPVFVRFEADGMSEFLAHEAYEPIACVTIENGFELPEDFEFDFSNDWIPIINDRSSCYIEWYASKDWNYAHHGLLITPEEPIYFYGR
ncbi:MAG: hypothetical protein QNJ45_19635 [Ardenticatenaceae bacterium]|nr:hypothetical protein [Ardenticatenaceae bacterium]